MYILAFDIGTSSIKSSLVSISGDILDTETYEYGLLYEKAGWVTQDSELWWTGARVTANQLLDRNPNLRNQINCIGVCGHMLGCLPVDAHGIPLSHAMIHADTRALDESEYIGKAVGHREIYRQTGSILSAQSPLAKVLWIKNNCPEIYKKTARFLQSKDYLVSKLTGNIDITDFSDASHAQWIDIHKKEYLKDVYAELSLDLDKFPALHKGTDITGYLKKPAAAALGLQADIPVIAGGGDGACASIGSGVTTSGGEVYSCIGTTAWISYNSQTPVIDEKSRIFDIMALDGESFGVFGTMQAAGKCIDWACDLFKIKDEIQFDKEAAMAPKGSEGLIFLPYLDGERSPIFDERARGMFFSIDANHKRPHFTRSVLEGVSFALRSILEVYREQKEISDLRVIGGGAQSSLWMQILSDICKTNIYLTAEKTSSITSLGVALAAAVGIGAYKNLDEASSRIAVVKKTDPDRNITAQYEILFEKYMRLYPQVKAIF